MPNVTPLDDADPRRIGRYRLAGRIAGMAAGSGYLARTVDGSEVTITLLGGDWAGDSAARDRFAAEASAARRVAPFCTARILDSGLDGGQAFLVSEHVAGSSLLEVVSAIGGLGDPELEPLAIGAATGLAAIHQAGLVHGNFGPNRLILAPAGPRVVAFGITPPYGQATPAADMLAWAQTMIFAAGGSPARPDDLNILPQPLRRVVAASLSTDPAARPAARSVLAQLLGEDDPPAGLLAEGSRRSAQPTVSSVPAHGMPAAAAGPRPPAAARSRPPVAGPGRQPPTAGPGQRTATGPQSPTAAGPRPPAAAGPRPPGAGPGRQSPARRSSPTLRTAGVVVLIVVIILAAAALIHTMLSGQPRPGALGPARGSGTGSSPAGSARPSASPSTSPSAPPTIPPAMTGSWSGQVRQANPADVFGVRIDLPTGGRSGTVSYAGATFACSGDLRLVSFAAGTLTLDQAITGQVTCANGVVTLRRGKPGTLLFRFQGQAGPADSGTLARR